MAVKHSKSLASSILLSAMLCGAGVRAEGPGFVAEPNPFATPSHSAATGAEDAPELELFKDIPVVVAAGKRAQSAQEAAAPVTIVTAEEIELFGYRSLADVLRAQRGFYLHTDGLNWFAGVRGFLRPGEWNARLLVLVDGRPTRENIYGQSHIDQDFVVPPEAIKQIEVIRGPGSTLYGTNAVFGVINVVTKNGADVNGVDVKLEAGTQDTARASILYGATTKDGWDILGGLTGYTSSGDKNIHYDGVNDASHNYGNIRGFDFEGVDSAFVKVSKGEFTAQADFASRQKANRSATYLTSWFDPGSMHEDRGNITLRLDHKITEDQSLHAMAYFGHYSYRQSWQYDTDGSGSGPYRYVTQGNDDWVGAELHYDWQISRNLHLLTGFDATQTLFAHQNDYDTLHGRILNIPSSLGMVGLFSEAEWKATSWLSLTAGLRLDFVEHVGTRLDPRFAAIFTPTKQDAVKLLYGQAFRAPNLYERLYSVPGSNDPNPGLKPEVVDTYEVVWEHEDKSGWHTTLDGFIWKMTDAMENVQLADGALQTQNGGSIWAHGVEGEVRRQWQNGASIRIQGNYTRAEHHGIEETHSPEWTAGISAVTPVFGKKTFLSIEPQVVGKMKSDLQETTSPTFLTNVIFTSRDIVAGWNLQIGAYGLFAGAAHLPRDGAFNQFQHTLSYPDTQYLVSLSKRF